MNNFRIDQLTSPRAASVPAIVLGSLLALGVSALPAAADGFLVRKGIAVGDSGAVGRTGGIISNGEGEGAFRRGGFALDGEGNGGAGKGGCVDGQSVNGCKGRGATWNSDGSFAAESGADFSGENGIFNSSRSLKRDADGNLTAGRSLDASGERGSYSGDTTVEDGIYSRDGSYSGSDGQSATVDSYWELGSGGSRTLICVDATGATVDCR